MTRRVTHGADGGEGTDDPAASGEVTASVGSSSVMSSQSTLDEWASAETAPRSVDAPPSATDDGDGPEEAASGGEGDRAKLEAVAEIAETNAENIETLAETVAGVVNQQTENSGQRAGDEGDDETPNRGFQ